MQSAPATRRATSRSRRAICRSLFVLMPKACMPDGFNLICSNGAWSWRKPHYRNGQQGRRPIRAQSSSIPAVARHAHERHHLEAHEGRRTSSCAIDTLPTPCTPTVVHGGCTANSLLAVRSCSPNGGTVPQSERMVQWTGRDTLPDAC